MMMTWMMFILVMSLLPVCMLITMSLRRIPSWGQGSDPEKKTILLTCPAPSRFRGIIAVLAKVSGTSCRISVDVCIISWSAHLNFCFHFRLCTINVRGLNSPKFKPISLFFFIRSYLDFCSMQEPKISDDSVSRAFSPEWWGPVSGPLLWGGVAALLFCVLSLMLVIFLFGKETWVGVFSV